MRPDAIPVQAVGSRAVVPPRDLEVLFGKKATLRPSATVEIIRLGDVVARVPIEAGDRRLLVLDAASTMETTSLSLRGPVGAVPVLEVATVRSRLMLPAGLRRAWGVGDSATVGLGHIAVAVTVENGASLVLEVERALWLGAGRPETARWMPGLALDIATTENDVEDGRIEGRVVTENDVRQARRKRLKIRLRPDQIVTPAARSLAREWDVFEDEV